MLINLRNAVLSLVAGSMFATSAQAGHFGGLPHIGGNGGGLAAAAKRMSNFKNSGSSNFGSLQNIGTAGSLALEVNGVQLVLEASAWTPNAIIAKVPTLNVANDAAIHFTAVRTDGASSQPFDPSAPAVVASR
jgi:hypothetical protein